jgi:hypothetical protein
VTRARPAQGRPWAGRFPVIDHSSCKENLVGIQWTHGGKEHHLGETAMGKSFRGMGKASAMTDRLIDHAERTKFVPPAAQPATAWKPTWTPDRWAHRTVTATKK